MVVNTELIKMTAWNGTQDTTHKIHKKWRAFMYSQACNSQFRRTLTGADITSKGREFNIT